MDELREMTFRELKNELLNGEHSKSDELMIRKLMKEKAIKYKLRQRALHAKLRSNSDSDSEEFLRDDDFLRDNDFADKNTSHLDEMEDPRHSNEVHKDHLNNHLMDRLNSEMLMRNNNKKAINKKKEFIPPFLDNNYGSYAPFHSEKSQKNRRNYN